MASQFDTDYTLPESTWLYRTKDFRPIPHADGFEIIGAHRDAIAWLRSHKSDNLREQFLDREGALVASDETELHALITAMQSERGS